MGVGTQKVTAATRVPADVIAATDVSPLESADQARNTTTIAAQPYPLPHVNKKDTTHGPICCIGDGEGVASDDRRLQPAAKKLQPADENATTGTPLEPVGDGDDSVGAREAAATSSTTSWRELQRQASS